MENIPKWVFIAVGMLITMLIIGFGIRGYYQTVPLAQSVNERAAVQAKLSEETKYSAYDFQDVSGSQIETAYRQFYNENPFTLYVQTNFNGVTKNFAMNPSEMGTSCRSFDFSAGVLTSGTLTNLVTEEQIEDENSSYYIPPQTRFKAVKVRDENGRVAALFFKQE